MDYLLHSLKGDLQTIFEAISSQTSIRDLCDYHPDTGLDPADNLSGVHCWNDTGGTAECTVVTTQTCYFYIFVL